MKIRNESEDDDPCKESISMPKSKHKSKYKNAEAQDKMNYISNPKEFKPMLPNKLKPMNQLIKAKQNSSGLDPIDDDDLGTLSSKKLQLSTSNISETIVIQDCTQI